MVGRRFSVQQQPIVAVRNHYRRVPEELRFLTVELDLCGLELPAGIIADFLIQSAGNADMHETAVWVGNLPHFHFIGTLRIRASEISSETFSASQGLK